MNLTHLHLILNHVPVIGVPLALTFLIYGIYVRDKSVQRFALMVIVAVAAIAVPVYMTGEPAEEAVENLPGVTESLIENHETAATVSIVLTLMAGAIGVVSLMFSKDERKFRLCTNSALVAAAIATAALAYTANLGGKVRHTEVRSTGSK